MRWYVARLSFMGRSVRASVGKGRPLPEIAGASESVGVRLTPRCGFEGSWAVACEGYLCSRGLRA